MAAYYLDSSAAAKLYVAEIGSSWVTGLADPIQVNQLFVSRVTSVEVAAAVARRVRAGTLDPGLASAALAGIRRDWTRVFRVVEVGQRVADDAVDLAERRGLRGYDCIQLASALVVQELRAAAGQERIRFVCADDELNGAARTEGLAVENPRDDP